MGKNLDRIARVAHSLNSRPGSVSLVALTDPERLADPWAVLRALPRGSAMIWRAYDRRPDYETARQLCAAARARHCVVIIAGAPHLAGRLGIGGIHLRERDIGRFRTGAFSLARLDILVTAACHSERAIVAAARAGADAVFISPVMPTESHPGGKALGIPRFAHLAGVANAFGLAAYALGGITTASHAARLRGTGAAGIAGISLLPPSLLSDRE